jgi:hypothetical protein
MANIKISQLPAKGANLASTDLVEISEFNGSGYVSKSITGQEIIDGASGGGVTDVTATAPLSSTGGSTPDIAITQAGAADDGYLSTGDWNAFNNKQDGLISGTNIKTLNGGSLLGSGGLSVQPTLVSGTNIKTINSTSILGSGNIAISSGVTSVTGTSPIVSSGGATPAISIATANTTTTGALSSTDWNTFNGKQNTLVSGTNIKTINGSSVLGSGDLVVGGGGGIHALIKPQSGIGVSSALTPQWTNNGANDNEMIFYPFIPAQSFTSTNLSLWVSFGSVGATFRALIYSNLNGLPNTKLFESTTIDGSTSGLKTITNTFNFVGGTTYWLCYHSGVSGAALVSINANATYSFAAKKTAGSTAFVNSYYLNFALGSAPTTATIIQNQTYNQALPNININV